MNKQREKPPSSVALGQPVVFKPSVPSARRLPVSLDMKRAAIQHRCISIHKGMQQAVPNDRGVISPGTVDHTMAEPVWLALEAVQGPRAR